VKNCERKSTYRFCVSHDPRCMMYGVCMYACTRMYVRLYKYVRGARARFRSFDLNEIRKLKQGPVCWRTVYLPFYKLRGDDLNGLVILHYISWLHHRLIDCCSVFLPFFSLATKNIKRPIIAISKDLNDDLSSSQARSSSSRD